MTAIHVDASGSYDVIVERGILSRTGEELLKLTKPCTVVLVSDENVFPLYGKAVKESLADAGFRTLEFIHTPGEEAKSLTVYGELLSFLSENHITRTDMLAALGGGVTGDLTGFAAATFQRGMPFVQLPTTLLAAVDSSVGGKTAINLPTAKNQVGCFYQPKTVLCDPDTLKTLNREQYRCGCAEVIKYAVMKDEAFFASLEATDIQLQEERVISTCVTMKRDVVREDEFDTGVRRFLNLGHTIGHAVEKCSGFTITHGDAVAIGLSLITKSAVSRGICGKMDYERIISVLEKYGLPVSCEFRKEDLASACLSDKKISGGKMHLIVPERIGLCRIVTTDKEDIINWIP